MGNYTIFFRCSKILGEAGKQEILAYENIRFSSLSAAGEVSRETSPAANRAWGNGCFGRLQMFQRF